MILWFNERANRSCAFVVPLLHTRPTKQATGLDLLMASCADTDVCLQDVAVTQLTLVEPEALLLTETPLLQVKTGSRGSF